MTGGLRLPHRHARTAPAGGGVLLVAAILLVAANLRPTVTSFGAILEAVRGSLGASTAWASVLTALPPVCFAAAGFAVPALTRRLGLSGSVGGATAVIAVGLVARVVDGASVVLLGTFVACAGIAICNVLIPVVIKECYPARIGLVTGLYTAGLQSFAAIASAATPQLYAASDDWRVGLGSWAGLAALAAVVWLLAAPRRGVRGRTEPDPIESTVDTTKPVRPVALLRNPLAWHVTGYFGTQSLFAYVVMGWLPEVLVDAGVQRGLAGVLFGLVSLLGVPISLVVTPLATRQRSQVAWACGLVLLSIAGVLGLLLAPSAAPLLWVLLVGFGMGSFSLAVAFISLRTRTSAETEALSTMAQSIGYLIGAIGPLLFGVLHGATGSWTASWLVAIVVLGAQFVFGLFAGRRRYV